MAEKPIIPIKENILPSSSVLDLSRRDNLLGLQSTSFEKDLSGKNSDEDPLLLATVGYNGVKDNSLPVTNTTEELYGARRFPVYNPDKTENEFAYGQSNIDKAANGLLKGLNIAGTTFAGSFGMLYGLARTPFTGRLADVWDNPIMRGLDEWNEKVDNEYLPNYYTDIEKDAKWYSTDNWFKTNFLFDKLIKNSGFAVGAMFSGNVANAALIGTGARLGNIASKVATVAEASDAFKSFTPLLRNTARAFSNGKNLEVAAVLEKEISSIADLTSRSSKLAQIAKETSTFSQMGDLGRRTAIALYSSAGEASFEALHTSKEFRNNLIDQYIKENGREPIGEDLEKINQYSESVGKTAFFGNMALLSATEYVQLPYLMGSSYRASRQAANRLATKEIDFKDGKYIMSEPTTKVGKLYDRARGASRYIFDPKEAGQEIGQYALQVGTQNYYNKAYQGNDADAWVDGFLYGFTDEKKGAFYSKEGMESLVLGGITGGVMQARNRFQESREKQLNTQSFLNELNNAPSFKEAFKDKLNSVNRGVVLQSEQEEAIQKGDKLTALDLKADMTHNYLSTRIKYGRLDMVLGDLSEMKQEGLTEEGLSKLKQEGYANINDNISSFQERLTSLEKSANTLNQLYESLNLRYSGQINEKGERLYPQDIIDKLTYAAFKISNYDERISSLSNQLSLRGVYPHSLLADLAENRTDTYKDVVKEIKNSDKLDKDELLSDLDDLIELSNRRKLFLKEYQELKDNPSNFKESVEKTTAEKKEIKIGEKDISTGEEYFLGKVVEYDEKGNEVYRFPRLTILGENEDGTIKIKTSNGQIRDVSKEQLADYKLSKVSDTLANKKAKFYMDHINTVFEFNFGKGKKQKGRLEYSPKEGILTFVYKDKSGKIRRIEVTADQFVPKKGYNLPIISAVTELTVSQKQSLDSFSKSKDERTINKREARLSILNELFEEVLGKQESSKKLINQKQAELANINKELADLQQKIENTQFTPKRGNFKASSKRALNSAIRLSRLKEDLQNEILQLETQVQELEFNAEYIADLAQNIDELPTDSSEFLEELNDQKNTLENLILDTGKNINSISKIIDNVDKALNTAIDFLSDLVNKFNSKYPKVPTVVGQEWIDFLKANPNFLKLKPNFREDLKKLEDIVAQVEDLDINPNERTLNELRSELSELQANLASFEKELLAKDLIISKFKEVADKYKKQKEEEKIVASNQKIIDQFLGTLTKDVELNRDNTRYEAEPKKEDEKVVKGTIGSGFTPSEYQKRANKFGTKFHELKEKINIKGIVVTQKTEEFVLPGLTDYLKNNNPDADQSKIIALVVVKDNEDGSFSLLDENGEVITENALNKAVFQTFPLEDLEMEYITKEGNKTKQTMFRETTPDEVKEKLKKQYTQWRNNTLSKTSLPSMEPIEASFGILEYVKKPNNEGTGFVIDYDAIVPVEDTDLLPKGYLAENPAILVATNNDIISEGTVTFKTPLGRVFLRVPGGLVKLNNTKIGNKKAKIIYDVILQLSKNSISEKGLKNPESTVLINWLKSIVYWGIPTNREGERKNPGYNSVWFEAIKEGEVTKNKLFISGKNEGFTFTPTSLEENKDTLILLLENLYHNTNASMVNPKSGKWNNKYSEITGIDKEGKPVIETWDNYQTYLLSSKGRKNEEIPLYTRVAPIKGTDKTNRNGIYFYLTSTPEEYSTPVKPATIKVTNEPVVEFVLDGKTENKIDTKFGTFSFTANSDLSKFVPTVPGEAVEKLTKKGLTEEQARQTLANFIFTQIQEKVKVEAPKPEQKPAEVTTTPSEKLKAWKNRPKTNISAPDDKAYRLDISKELGFYKREDWGKVEKFLKDNFPNIPVYRVKNAIQATNGRQAWGMLHNGAIYLAENAEVGTIYHEVFEAVWKMVTNLGEQTQLINEFKSRKGSFINKFTGEETKYSEATDFDIKEQLAEEFRDFILNKEVKDKKSFIARLFDEIWNFLKEFFVGPNAQSNTNKLFEKIGNGYYKTFSPYESALSYAKVGLIDIDSVSGDITSNYRLSNIPATQVHEIMQQMTYSILSNLSKNNESLFKVNNKEKKSDVYNRLKNELYSLIDWKSRLIEEAVESNELTQENADKLLDNYAQLWSDIDSQWGDIISLHEKQYLKKYDIEFDENDNIVLGDESNSGKEDYQDARKIDNFRKANPAVKLLLATLPEVDSEGKVKRNSIFGVNLLSLDKTFITLMNNLHSSINIDDMLERLRKFAIANPNYIALYKRLVKSEVTDPVNYDNLKNDYDFYLLSAFYKAFKRNNPDVKIVYITNTGEVAVGDAHLSDAVNTEKQDMQNNIISSVKPGNNKYITFNKKTKEYEATDLVKKLKLNPKELDSYTAFLNELGITFSKQEVVKFTSKQKDIFVKAVDGLKSSIEDYKGIADLNRRTLNIDNRLRELATVKVTLTNPEFESTYFSVSGERHQTYIGTNLSSDLYDTLSKINNIAELQDTRFAYLLTDNFSKNSVILQKIFNPETGNKVSGAEDILKTGIADGINDDLSGKKKEASKLTEKERLIQELNLNNEGWFLQLVPGDASMEHMIKLFAKNPFVTTDRLATSYQDIFDIFKGYFIDEINVSREERKIANVKGRKSTDLRFLNGILGKEINNEVTTSKENSNKSAEELYEKYKDKLNSAIEKLIKEKAKNRRNELFRFGIAEYTEEGIILNGLNILENQDITEDNLLNSLEALEANYIVANIELHKLIYSDPYFYKDELKRIKNFNSPGQPLVSSQKINTTLNKVFNKSFRKGDIGYTDFGKQYLTKVVLNDVISDYTYEGYDPFEETDGQGIITLQGLRNYAIRAGEWTEDNEKQYKYDIAWEKRDKNRTLTKEDKEILERGNPEIKSTYTTRKPIVRGSMENGENYNDISLDKFALMVYSYRILKEINPNSNALKLYNKMMEEEVDYAVFDTGAKVYTGEKQPLYNEDGSFNTEKFTQINNVPFDIIYVQSEVPSKDNAQVTQGSQVTKLVTVDFLQAGVPLDFEPRSSFDKRFSKWVALSEDEKKEASPLYVELKKNETLLIERIKEGYSLLLKKLGIQEQEEGYVLTDRDKLVETLESEIFKQEINDNIVDAFEGFKKGDTVLEATPAYQQIRNILFSIANKQITRPTVSGGLKVQVTSSLLESNRVKARKVNNKTVYSSDILDFYTDKDGKRVAEVMVGRWFKSDLSDNDLLNYLNNTEEGKRILEGVAFRIPTQKQNSIDAFRIKKFLPQEFGDQVVIPSALVKKVGSDFDIDKLSMYFKNVYRDYKGNVKIVPFFGYGENAKNKISKMYDEGNFLSESDRKRLNNWIKEENKEYNTVEGKLIKSIFGQEAIDNSVIDDFMEYNSNSSVKDRMVDLIYKQSLENEYIQSTQNLVSHPLNFKHLMKPNSADQLKGLAKEIQKMLDKEEVDYSSISNMLDREFMSNLRHAFVTGKYAIGIAATAQTNNAQNQRTLIYIDDDRLSTQSKDDKKWLGDGQIKFNEFNKTIVDGKNKPTLSFPENPKGQFISDIIGQFIDGYVDISKGPWIMELGAYPNVAGTWLFLTKIGVPIDTVAYFMNQPIIREYLSTLNNEGYTWLFNDRLVKDMMEIYNPQSKQETPDFIPSNTKLKEMIGKSKKELSDQQLETQLFILEEFLKYAKLAEHLFHVQQATNFDTATINDPFLILKKEKQIEKAKTTMISDVDKLMESSFVGELRKAISKVRDAYSTILVSDRKGDNKKVGTREVLEKVLDPYINIPDRDFVKVARKAVNDLFDWAVQNDPDLSLNTKIQSILLGTESKESAAEEVLNLKKQVKDDETHPLYNNFILNALRQDPNSKENTPQNLYIVGKHVKMYDQNQIIYGFNELKKHISPDLYDKIVYLSVIQSGLNNSKISFTSLLPYEDFKRIYNNSLSVIDKMSNLQEFYNLHVFERNNWNDSDIVPFMRTKLVPKKGEPGFWDISMGFVDKRLKSATLKGEIPQIIHISPYTKEGRSEFVVFQWENKKLSKAERRERKRKGDTSHISKSLFRRVNNPETGEPYIYSSTTKGKTYENYLYVAINAWGDSYRANELYAEIQPSIINNGFEKIQYSEKELVEKIGPSELRQTKYTSDEVSDEKVISYITKKQKVKEDTSNNTIPPCA